MDRLELIKDLNNKVLRKLNQWSSNALNGLYFDFEQYSDFCCIAKRNGQCVEMSQEEMLQIYEFFNENFYKHGIGFVTIPPKIYLGTAHLATGKLESLHHTPDL